MNVYRCPICGYLHLGERNFHFCPICSAPAEHFKQETALAHFANWDVNTRMMILNMADSGQSHKSGKGTTRAFRNLDDLLFLPAQISRMPLLEAETVATDVVLGKQAERSVLAQTPILNAGMSFGALSREAKMALAKASAQVGGVANTGEGGMLDEERELADKITLQYSTGRFGVSDDRLKLADMIEIKVSQGAKPAMGGLLPGAKVTQEIAAIRQIPPGATAHSPARHPDIDSPEALSEKIAWLRDISGGKPISLKFVGGHIRDDLDAIFSQQHIPDVLVIDGGEGGTGAAPTIIKDHVGLPLLYSLPRVAEYLHEHDLQEKVTLIAAGGIRHAGDVAKLLALGAEAVYMGGALKIALGCQYIRACHTGTCPFGIATQDPYLRTRLHVDQAAQKIANFIAAATEELKSIARICGKHHVRELDKRDLAAIHHETARITGVELG